MGTPLLSLYLVIAAWTGVFGAAGYLLIPGGLIHIIGSFIVTIVANVPLNNRLDVVDPKSSTGRQMWEEYDTKWVPWNHVRTVAAFIAVCCLSIGLLLI